jgi:hypothetical protein
MENGMTTRPNLENFHIRDNQEFNSEDSSVCENYYQKTDPKEALSNAKFWQSYKKK